MTGPEVLAVLRSWEPAAPRLVWYGEDGERIELSGRVLTNWVIKAANLLVNECSVEPGHTVALDLPVHWRALVWALGAWALKAESIVDGEAAEVVVTSSPDRWADHDDVVAVALPALARQWPTPLPGGVIDGAADLMTEPDQPAFATAPAPAPDRPVRTRVLLLTSQTDVAAIWEQLSSDAAVVLVTERDSAALARIAAQEGARPVQ